MNRGGIDEEEKPVGELFGKLIDEGKAYAKAEIDLAKASAEAKADSAKKPVIIGFAALLFLQSATTVFAITIGFALATLIGPLAGGLIATAIALGIAALLGLWAVLAHPRPLTLHLAASALFVIVSVWEWGSFHGGWRERLAHVGQKSN